MNGGLSQQARVLRLVNDAYSEDLAMLNRAELEAFNRASHSDALRELQLAPDVERRELRLAPAEDLQASDHTDAIGDPVALIRSIGPRRLAIAATIAVTIWCATAAFAVMCGGPN
ncbi:hypothetical protein [Sphingopyxis terrae]|uniref:hypothetical protein n=1 Tax=Sphingopyxis terrae TaxID=33052 RepID=UPI003F7E1E2A